MFHITETSHYMYTEHVSSAYTYDARWEGPMIVLLIKVVLFIESKNVCSMVIWSFNEVGHLM